MGYNRDGYRVGTRMRGEQERGETYQVGTGSELTGVVSERVLTLGGFCGGYFLKILNMYPMGKEGFTPSVKE